ncbi:ATP-binding protein [Deinococcus koreensis]|uniref:ATP-binding protein n=1 Tax=Deinococcus koreensis TaxID=2054903 RepID=UPI0013FD9294|nr:ATP-binding protein [Deinococcus koreensis]
MNGPEWLSGGSASGSEQLTRPLRVLIVDDSPEDAETFSTYLRGDPRRPRQCETLPLGELALERMLGDLPDCVLLDYSLPDMTGLEWLEQARPGCAVVMLTGLGDEAVAVAAMKAGAQDYLVKGRLSAETLRRALDGAVERYELQRRLAQANARTASVLASVTDAFMALDATFHVQYLNAAAETLTRRRAGSPPNPPLAPLLGASLWEVFPWLESHELGEQLRGAQRERFVVRLETQLSPLDGWYEVRIYPADDGLTVYFSDVSERRQAQALSLRASERLERLHRAGVALNAARSLAEVTACIVRQAAAVFGAVGGTLALQHLSEPVLQISDTFGVSDEEVRAWPLLPLAAPFPLCDAVRSREPVLLGTREEATLWYPRLFDSGEPHGHQAWAAVPLLRGDQVLGSLGLMFGTPQPFESDERTLMLAYAELGAQALARAQIFEAERELRASLERRVEARTAELRQSNRELEQFASVASHDLREPLRTISSYAQLLAGRYGPELDDRGVRYLNFILDGTGRLHRLIEDLLALSRVGTHGSTFSLTDTGALLDNTLKLLGTAIEESGARVSTQALPQVTADATQLGQLFQNLIANALKFRRAGVAPQVQVGAAREGAYWRFTVADNGLGIAPEHAEQVFHLFQRLHHREEYPGNGIGLSVCQKIVVRHGGRIGVDSLPGQGSTFWFTLPATPASLTVTGEAEPRG